MQRIIVKNDGISAALRLIESPEPQPLPNEAVVAVHSVSLNRGEVARALQRAEDGWEPGWDFAGTVVQKAADGSGPDIGARVVGMLDGGAWAERIAAATSRIAMLPDGVTFESASALPVAGLTALYALQKGGVLAGKEVLVTGASGGLGQFAIQLALLSSANVTALVHRNIPAGGFNVLRADSEGLAELSKRRFDLIIESVGGEVFAAAARSIAPGGTLVTLGATAGTEARFDIREFFNVGRAQIYGFNIFDEVADKPASHGLARLLSLVESGALQVPVTYHGAVPEFDAVARQLLASQIPGKAVLSWAA